MGDLRTRLAAAAPPRTDELADEVARIVEPRWWHVLLGVVYFVGLADPIAVGGAFAVFGVAKAAGADTDAGWLVAACMITWLAVMIAASSFFRRWMRRRRAPAAELGRAGAIADGFVRGLTLGRGQRVVIGFEDAGTARVAFGIRTPFRPPAKETPVSVLHLPGYRTVLYFTPDGAHHLADTSRTRVY